MGSITSLKIELSVQNSKLKAEKTARETEKGGICLKRHQIGLDYIWLAEN